MKERWPEMLEYQQKVQAMTDLERAQAVLSKVSLARSPVKTMMAILAAARREGAEEAMKQFHELEFVSLNELNEARAVAFREGMEHAARIDKAMLDAARREGAEAERASLALAADLNAAAERRGAEEMRERAAQAADKASALVASTSIRFGSISEVAADLAKDLADAIRALPLTPEADEQEGGRGSAG